MIDYAKLRVARIIFRGILPTVFVSGTGLLKQDAKWKIVRNP